MQGLMPKFIYTILIFVASFWGIFAFVLFNLAPSTWYNIFIFLMFLCAAFSLTLSIPIYIFYYKKAPEFANLRLVYRKSLKWGVFCGCSVCCYLLLRILRVDTVVNVGLLLLLVVSVGSFLKSHR